MSGGATAVLVRWANGHVYAGGGDREVYVNMAAVSSRKQALAYAGVILDGQGGTLSTEAVQGLAYWDAGGFGHYPPQVLSGFNGRRVVGVTAEMSGELTTVSPALNDPVADRDAALRRRIERASADTVSLWGSPRRTGSDQGGGDASTPADFVVSGSLAQLFEEDDDGEISNESPLWRAKTGWRGCWMSASLLAPGASTTHVRYLRLVESGTNVGRIAEAECYIAKGKRTAIARIGGPGLKAGAAHTIRLQAYGIGARDLTVTLHGAPL